MLDVLAWAPKDGEYQGPDLRRLPALLEQIERHTMLHCYQTVRRISEGLNYLMLYRQLFPLYWARSTASAEHVHHSTYQVIGAHHVPRFSPKELEFFRHVAEELFPLRDEFYRTRSFADGTADNWVPIYLDYFGIVPQFLHEEQRLGHFILTATANAVVNDSLWQHHLRKIGLNWTQHGPRCLKEAHALGYNSLKYDTAPIFAGMAELDSVYVWLPEAWEYATNRTGSEFLDLNEHAVIEGRYDQPEWNLETVQALAADWRRAAQIKEHFDELAETLANRPPDVQTLLELIGRYHTADGHVPVRDEILWAHGLRTVGEEAAFYDACEAAEIDARLRVTSSDKYYPPTMEITNLTEIQHD